LQLSVDICGLTIVAVDSSLDRCRSRAAILSALVAFGVVCHAQMARPDPSDVKSCETELANCQALLVAVGAKDAKDLVQPLAIIAKPPGTPSSAAKGARLRSSPPPIRLACADCMGLHAGAPRVCARPARAVQSQVRLSSRTWSTRCSRPTARIFRCRTQRAVRAACGNVERTAVRAWARSARVGPSHRARTRA
jgi:hypothetical protein